MSTIELRTNFHELIDSFNNDSVLSKFYDLLLKAKESKESQLWSRLTIEEQEELKQIEENSHNSENIIAHSEVLKKHTKWL